MERRGTLCCAALELEPSDYRALVHLGQAFEGRHKLRAALHCYSAAARLRPNDRLARSRLHQTLASVVFLRLMVSSPVLFVIWALTTDAPKHPAQAPGRLTWAIVLLAALVTFHWWRLRRYPQSVRAVLADLPHRSRGVWGRVRRGFTGFPDRLRSMPRRAERNARVLWSDRRPYGSAVLLTFISLCVLVAGLGLFTST